MSAVRTLARAANESRIGSAVARGLLPEPVFRALATRVGGRMPEMVDVGAAELLRQAPLEQLADAGALERELLPALGLADDVPFVMPEHLQGALGRGLRHWQYPNQFAPYLVEVARRGVRSYLEIGVRHGGSFVITVEYLSRFGTVDRATAVDIDSVPALVPYRRQRPQVEAVRLDSRSRRFGRLVAHRGPYDLAFIDGNHAYEAVRSDFEAVRPHARMLVLHDVVDHGSPGVRRLWQEVRHDHADEYEFLEFTAQYPEIVERIGHPVLGIGLAVRRA